jgi:orotate phosphoribosyltransferase
LKKYKQDFIELAIRNNALKFGDFTLKSKRISPYFFNAGQLSSSAALHVLGDCYAQAIIDNEIEFETIFGPAYKGIPISTATAVVLHQKFNKDVNCAFDRKEIKDHGEGGQIIGNLSGNTLIVDDVITAGTAIRHALGLITEYKGKHAGIMVALDRQEKGSSNKSAVQEIQQEFGLTVYSIINFDDIREYVLTNQSFSSYSEKLQNYREVYGV